MSFLGKWAAGSIIFLLVIAVAIGIYANNQYTLLNQISAQVLTYKIKDITFSGAGAEFTLDIHNPSDINLNVNSLVLDIFLNSGKVATVESKYFTIPAKGNVKQDFEFRIGFASLGLSALTALKEQSADFNINGKAEVTLPFGYVYTHEFKIPQEE